MNTDEEILITSVGARIKHLRFVAGHTQGEMAERMGISLRNYQRLETGDTNMSLRTVARLAAALEVPPSELFTQLVPLDDGA